MVQLLFYTILLLLTACTERQKPAPVEELAWHPALKSQLYHTVKPGETLYAIAFRYDKDYRNLATLNHLSRSYTLQVGQVLKLQGYAKPQRIMYKKPRSVYPIKNPGAWHWPLRGTVASRFFPEQGKKGINIAGKKGEKILASAEGIVAYAGNGLAGYGNLIIIKHSHEFLTAYGNNAKNVVKEGQRVRKGQVIAEIGIIDRQYWGVHFEMRKAGNPVNPLHYLQQQNG
jgi:lipoprotein NlpD